MIEGGPQGDAYYDATLLRETETFFLHESFGQTVQLLNEIDRLLQYPHNKKAKERRDVLLAKLNLEWPYYGEPLTIYGKVFTPEYDSRGLEVHEYHAHTAKGEQYMSHGFVVHPMYKGDPQDGGVQQLRVWALLDDGVLMPPRNLEASIPYDSQEALLTRLLHFQPRELKVINTLLRSAPERPLDAMKAYQPNLYIHDAFYHERVADLEAYLTQIMDFDNELPSLVQVSGEDGEPHQYVMQPQSIMLAQSEHHNEGIHPHSLRLSALRHSSRRTERPVSVTVPLQSVMGITPIRQLEL